MSNKDRVTILDIAAKANVSKMSVWRAINGRPGVSEKTRQHILEIMDELGYDAPVTLAPNEMEYVVALVFGDIETQYSVEIMRGITDSARRNRCDLMLYSQHENDHDTASILNDSVNGVLIVTPWEHENLTRTLRGREVPYVFIDHYELLDGEICVFSTNERGAVDATRHLLALGHTRIGYITGQSNHFISQERMSGYKSALAEVDIEFDPVLVREGNYGDPSSGHQQAQALLDLNDPPTAIFCANDLLAVGAMRAVQERGLFVGRDVSIIGFDDIALASIVFPPLTTVRQPIARMGERALDLLLMQMRGHNVPPSLTNRLQTELVIRESSKRLARN